MAAQLAAVVRIFLRSPAYGAGATCAIGLVALTAAGRASSPFGYPAFVGINIDVSGTEATTGVPVASTFVGMPANEAGIGEGDVITAVNGVAMTTPDQLTAAIQAHKVGDTVNISWIDPEGISHTAPVTLVAGPAA